MSRRSPLRSGKLIWGVEPALVQLHLRMPGLMPGQRGDSGDVQTRPVPKFRPAIRRTAAKRTKPRKFVEVFSQAVATRPVPLYLSQGYGQLEEHRGPCLLLRSRKNPHVKRVP